jgi:hypothetical protein
VEHDGVDPEDRRPEDLRDLTALAPHGGQVVVAGGGEHVVCDEPGGDAAHHRKLGQRRPLVTDLQPGEPELVGDSVQLSTSKGLTFTDMKSPLRRGPHDVVGVDRAAGGDHREGHVAAQDGRRCQSFGDGNLVPVVNAAEAGGEAPPDCVAVAASGWRRPQRRVRVDQLVVGHGDRSGRGGHGRPAVSMASIARWYSSDSHPFARCR